MAVLASDTTVGGVEVLPALEKANESVSVIVQSAQPAAADQDVGDYWAESL